jgi:hypothetical protein
MKTAAAPATVIEIGGESPTNGGDEAISFRRPYVAAVTIVGVADILFHRWNVEGVDIKAAATKGSKAKKSDDLETYVYRDESGQLCLPTEYLRQSIIFAAKFRQDPRSPRKSAMDLFKAGVVALTNLAPLGVDQWDYEDRRRALVQRQAINRTRPAMRAGWGAAFEFQILVPEYISPALLHEVLIDAGRLIGIGDFRPTFGRFQVTKFSTDEV